MMNMTLVNNISLEIKKHRIQLVDKSVINKIFESPFELGKIYLPFSVNTFYVMKVKNKSFIYEKTNKSSDIKITEIESNRIFYSETSPIFQTDNECKIEFPIFKYLDYPLFGLEEVENQLKNCLDEEGNGLVVLYGQRGCGKKSIMKKLADEMPDKIFYWINCLNWFYDKDYLKSVQKNFIKEKSNKLVLCCNFVNNSDANKEILNIFHNILNQSQIDVKILFAITVPDLVNLNPFENQLEEVFIKIIDQESRFELFKYLVNQYNLCDSDILTQPEWKRFSDYRLKQFSGKDVKDFVDNVYHKFQEITLERLESCRNDRDWVPSDLLEFIADLEPLRWTDIGGYESVKSTLIERIVEPLKAGKETVKGVLFHGPPGCSKTMFARALATETGLNLICIKPSTVMRGYVGESEILLKQIFNRAIAMQPSILFIDEIDMIFSNRELLVNSPVSLRMMSELLIFLGGIGEGNHVIFMAATNFPDKLDPAVIRSGRIDLHLHIDLPDQIARESILGIIFPDSITNESFIVADEVKDNLEGVAKQLEGKSGADIVEFGKRVKHCARMALPMEMRYMQSNRIVIRMSHIKCCLSGNETITEIDNSYQLVSISMVKSETDPKIEFGNNKSNHNSKYELFDCEELIDDILSYLRDDRTGKCLILYGNEGCGKRSMIKQLKRLMQQTIFISLTITTNSQIYPEITKAIDHNNRNRKHTVIVIDGTRKMDDDLLLAAEIILMNEAPNVKVIMIYNDMQSVPYQLSGYANKRVYMSFPKDTKGFLRHMMFRFLNIKDIGNEIDEIANNLHGFSPKKIKILLIDFADEFPMKSICQLLEFSREMKNTTNRLHVKLEPLLWSDIGGYESVKNMIIENIVMPLKYEVDIPRGILFHGPPGCSKTMFVRALATECQLNIFNITPSDIMRGIVGESEAVLRQIFSQALDCSPSIIFIDEIDLLIPKRSANSKPNVSERILSELMTFLSGIETKKDQKVILVGATNRLDEVDEALMRPGRMSLIVPIGLPDQQARESILKIALSDENLQIEQEIINNISLIAESLKDKSGAEIVNVVRRMKTLSILASYNNRVASPIIKYQYFLDAMETLRCQEPNVKERNDNQSEIKDLVTDLVNRFNIKAKNND